MRNWRFEGGVAYVLRVVGTLPAQSAGVGRGFHDIQGAISGAGVGDRSRPYQGIRDGLEMVVAACAKLNELPATYFKRAFGGFR